MLEGGVDGSSLLSMTFNSSKHFDPDEIVDDTDNLVDGNNLPPGVLY